MNAKHTHGDFSDIIALADDMTGPICLRLRAIIMTLDPQVCEIVWPKHKIASYGVGPKKMTEHYAYIGVQKAHVNLGFYHGADFEVLRDLLEGTGKNLRHLKLRSLQDVESTAVKRLLQAAIAERRKALKLS